jgi:(E)-4-hydroxy-3-methylbut-2-enyl-diphosphate synthase
MSVRPYRDIIRRKSRKIRVGAVEVGGDAPISVQSMTNTPTSDAHATIAQVKRLEDAGADIVRVSCPDEESTQALKAIVRAVRVPIVADIHFHYKRAIEAAEAGAACLRINPGNIGSEQRVREVVKAAKDHGCSMRIGVNAGSLERDLLEKYGEPMPKRWWKAPSAICACSRTMISSNSNQRESVRCLPRCGGISAACGGLRLPLHLASPKPAA